MTTILGGAQTDFAINWTRREAGPVEMLEELVPAALQACALEPDQLARLRGWGHRTDTLAFEDKLERARQGGELLRWTRQAIEDAYRRADLSAEDVDVIETHDCFTVGEFLQIGAFGLAGAGREHEFVEQRRLTLEEGDVPINPSGGLIGCGHPVGASGVRMALDLHRQVCGLAGDYQVADARVGAMLNIGGSFTTNISLVIEAE